MMVSIGVSKYPLILCGKYSEYVDDAKVKSVIL